MNWTIVPFVTEALGAAGPPGRPDRGGVRDAVGRGGARLPARRGRPGRGVRQPHGRERARGENRLTELASTRSAIRADDRARARPVADVEVAPHALLDRRRAASTTRTSPPRRCSRSPDPQRADGSVEVDEAARPQRRFRRPRPALPASRAAAPSRSRRTRARETLHHAGRHRRGRGAGSARSRSSTGRDGSGRSAPSSTTRSSTRTPPATSRSAAASRGAVEEEDVPRVNVERGSTSTS